MIDIGVGQCVIDEGCQRALEMLYEIIIVAGPFFGCTYQPHCSLFVAMPLTACPLCLLFSDFPAKERLLAVLCQYGLYS